MTPPLRQLFGFKEGISLPSIFRLEVTIHALPYVAFGFKEGISLPSVCRLEVSIHALPYVAFGLWLLGCGFGFVDRLFHSLG